MNVDCFLHFIWAFGYVVEIVVGFLMFRCLVFLGSNRSATRSSSGIYLAFVVCIMQPLLCCLPSHEVRENALISISGLGDFGKNNIKVHIFLTSLYFINFLVYPLMNLLQSYFMLKF
jgi:hypothetical protein